MLTYLYADQLENHPKLQHSMFCDRATQFRNRLDWKVCVDPAGLEKDTYDHQNPLYVIWKTQRGTHGGSMRVLPTTGPCMYNDHFSHIGTGTIISPLIWESTRFCLAPDIGKEVIRTSAALMLTGCEIGLRFGLKQAIGVFDPRMVRIYRALGWPPDVLGCEGSGRAKICVGLWEFSELTRLRLARKAGISTELSRLWFNRAFGGALEKTAAA